MKVVSGTQEYRVNFYKVHKGRGGKSGVDTKCVISHVLNPNAERQFNDIELVLLGTILESDIVAFLGRGLLWEEL